MDKIKSQMSGGAKLGLAGAVVAAIAASACCVGPLVLMLLGISGAWIGNLTALTPYQPIFMTVALGLLGLAFYKVYGGKKEESCAPGSACSNPKMGRLNKIVLWIFAALVLGLLVFPYAVPYVFAETAEAQPQAKQVTLDVENMTCYTCAIPVRKSLEKVDGVVSAKVTMRPPQAVVIYDPARVTTEDLTRATTNAGYPSKVKGEEAQK